MKCPGWEYTHTDTLNKQPSRFNKAQIFFFIKFLFHAGGKKKRTELIMYVLMDVRIRNWCSHYLVGISPPELSVSLTKTSSSPEAEGKEFAEELCHRSFIPSAVLSPWWLLRETQSKIVVFKPTPGTEEGASPHGERWYGGQECCLTPSFMSFVMLSLLLRPLLREMVLAVYA